MIDQLVEKEKMVIPYDEGFAIAAYNTVANVFSSKGELRAEDLPLEFIAIAREGLNKFFSENSSATVADFTEIEMPDKEAMPSVMNYIAARQTPQGGYQLFDKLSLSDEPADLLDIDVVIPPEDRRAGNIPDLPSVITAPNPTLPNAILSNSRLDQMQSAIQKRFSNGDRA